MQLKTFNFLRFKATLVWVCTLFFVSSNLLIGNNPIQSNIILENTNACKPKQEFTKNIHREFTTVADGMVALYNKYGKVTVNSWTGNNVKIDINIIVNAKNQADAGNTFDRIKINFTNTAGYVKAETIIEQPSMRGFNTIFAGSWDNNSCQDFKINYDVWMPIGNQLDLKNKYGDSYVGALNGKLLAEIKYGDLRTEAISNSCDLTLGYGKANMTSVQNLTGSVSYAELTLQSAKDVQLDTKYSELKLERAGDVRLVSKYDDLEFGTLADLRLQTKYGSLKAKSTKSAFVTAQYTDLEMGTISENLDVDLQYGGLNIENLSRNFKDVTIKSNYTNIEIDVEHGAIYRFELEGSYTDISTPSGAKIIRKDEVSNWESVKEAWEIRVHHQLLKQN